VVAIVLAARLLSHLHSEAGVIQTIKVMGRASEGGKAHIPGRGEGPK